MLTEPDDISGFDFTSVRPEKPTRKVTFNAATRDYVASLPRGERQRAENTIRLYMVGPAQLSADAALARFKQRRVRDAQAPVGDTAFDDSGEEDQDLGEFTGGSHYTDALADDALAGTGLTVY
eukprot:COSAG06_NODE_37147_length_438_cov_2.486726_1_plen_123_part_00